MRRTDRQKPRKKEKSRSIKYCQGAGSTNYYWWPRPPLKLSFSITRPAASLALCQRNLWAWLRQTTYKQINSRRIIGPTPILIGEHTSACSTITSKLVPGRACASVWSVCVFADSLTERSWPCCEQVALVNICIPHAWRHQLRSNVVDHWCRCSCCCCCWLPVNEVYSIYSAVITCTIVFV